MQSETPQTKADVLDLIRNSHAALEQAVAQLTDEQLSAPNADGGWSVKDHMAHITVWEQVLLRAHIGGESYGQAVDGDTELATMTDIDAINDWLHRRNKDHSLDDVRAAFDQIYQQMLATLEAMNESELLESTSRIEPEQSMLETIAGNTWTHYDEHTATIRRLIAEGNEQQR